MSTEFYDRPMVESLTRIFGDPLPPTMVTERQFDYMDVNLKQVAAKPWHEIGQRDYRYYLLDLSYVELQQDLFDYLFPALLIRWWEGQLDRTGGPESECTLYYAIDQGQVLNKMMDEPRRQLVLNWMANAYIEGVDAWSNQFSLPGQNTKDNFYAPLWSFNALGQSVPVIRTILQNLANLTTVGRAQW